MLPSDELYAQDLQRRRAEREANSVEIKEPSLPQSFSVIFRKLRSLRILWRAHGKNMYILNNVHTPFHIDVYITYLLPSIIDEDVCGRKDETHFNTIY